MISANSVRVGDLAEQIRGVSYGKSDAISEPKEGYLPILRAGNIIGSGLVFDDLVYVPSGKVSKKQKIQKGDIVIAASSGSLDVVGKAGLARKNYEVGFGAFCKVLRPNPSLIEPNYFAHFFQTKYYRRKISSLAAGANINNLKNEHLDELQIPLPPIPKQRQIAAILDQADNLRIKRRETLEQLDKLTQSIFIEMFGDPVINQRNWPRRSLGGIGKVITGNTPPRDNPANYGNTIEWIKSDNINTPFYYLTKAEESLSEKGKAIGRIAPKGSILVTCIAGSPDCIGNAAMTDREVAFNQQINAFIPDFGDPHFYYGQFLIGKKLIQDASTGGMKGMVSKSRFEEINLIVPPADLQQEFSSRVLCISKLKIIHQNSLTQLDAIFASLQQRAFQGEL